MALLPRRAPTRAARVVLPAALASAVKWNRVAQRYYDTPSGRFVGPATVREVADAEVDANARRMSAYARELAAGQITLARWRDLMAQAIKLNLFLHMALARGGFAALGERDYRELERLTRRQFKYLQRFALALEARPEQLQRPGFLARVKLYAHAGRGAYEQARRESHRAAGFLYERNVLHARESCAGCLAQSALGWVAVGTLVPVGERTCIVLCRCTLAFRRIRPSRGAP